MPGHSYNDKSIETTIELANIVKEYDVLFLVTDSRESRWLPTVLGAVFGKVVFVYSLDCYHCCIRI